MNIKLLEQIPPESLFKDGNISISPLKEGEEKYFKFAVSRYVSPAYPGTEYNYTNKILFEHFIGTSSGCNSTSSRIIYSVKLLDILIGFFVLSHKKSESVKLSPCVFFPEYINKGYGELVVTIIENIYKNTKYKKLFTTIPAIKPIAISSAMKSGFDVETVLKKHYSKDYDEIILSKNLTKDIHTQEKLIFKEKEEFKSNNFVCSSNINFNKNNFKILFNVKRGGAIKINSADNDEILFDFIKFIQFEKKDIRKIYSIVSLDYELSILLENNFQNEGKIFLPSSVNDFFVFSKNI